MTRTLAPAARAPARTLVGRSDLLAILESCLAAGDSVLLDGPRGIGKSALLDALGAAARVRGELVLRASGAEGERWLGYQGLADLLAPVPEEYFAAITGRQRLALQSVLRGRRAGDDRAKSARRLGWLSLLVRCAEDTPVLVLIDDAHWLDPATVDVLAYAARRLDGLPVRFVLTGRGSERALVPAPVTEATIPPLTSEDIADLLDTHGMSARVATKIHADSAGNPHLALALAGGPGRAQALVQTRLAEVSDQVMETLLVCALATRPTLRLLLRAGRAEADADLAAAVDAGLVATDGENIRFTPPDAALVVAHSVTAVRRAAVHLALADVVTFAAEADRHRALAATGPDAASANALATAAENALRRGARDLAAELYVLAADRTPPELEGSRVRWLVEAAELGAIASLPELVEPAVAAVLAAESEPAQRVRARLSLLRLSGQALATMEETLALAHADAGGDPALLATTHLWRAWAAVSAGTTTVAVDEATLSHRHARSARDQVTESMALAVHALAARSLGLSDAHGLLDAALALGVPAADGLWHMGARFTSARYATFDDRLDEARAELLALLAVVDRGGPEELLAVCRALSEVDARVGRCREALDYADRAVRVAAEFGLSPGPAWSARATAELAGGTLAAARSCAERGVRACVEENDLLYQRRHLHLLAQAKLRDGDAHGGVEALRQVKHLESAHGIQDPTAQRWHGDLITGLVTLGEIAEAADLVDELRSAPGSGAGFTGTLDRAEASLRAATGDPERAMSLVRSAREVFHAIGQPIEEGHCLLVEAKVERRRRHYTAARAAAEAAAELFAAIGANPWLAEAQALMVRLGDVGDTGGTLTASEARIAAMVGEGASNQEIADRLYLSRKTIEAALTRIYRKLGIRSRTQLIRHIHAD
ncbi:AAA family ATPase [Actinokineospora sp. HUAS TT18]|uniref:helix-turn-helix transcriptional regulator n=1 Tax=Actinokineospora sp. HUAS TT18 TaxID=3447451 RepID=UPI003F526608